MLTQYNWLQAQLYDKIISPQSVQIKKKLLQPYLDALPPGSRVLDIGCGGGHLLKLLAQNWPNLNFTGIDNSETLLQIASVRIHSNNAQIILGSALNMPFSNEEFDFVFSIASLKHWPNLKVGLIETLRVLKKNSHLVLTELDQKCDNGRLSEFISTWKLPFFLVPLVKFIYRHTIIKNSTNPESVERILKTITKSDFKSETIPYSPAFKIVIQK